MIIVAFLACRPDAVPHTHNQQCHSTEGNSKH